MTLPVFTPGFRLIDGSDLNLMVDAINGSTPLDGLANGSAAAPSLSFANSATTGVFRSASNILGFAANGAAVGTVDANGFNGALGGTTPAAVAATTVSATGVASFANGLVGTPALTFTSDPDTGFYRVGANSLGVTAGGALVGSFTATGFQGAVGATTPAAGTFTVLTATTGVDGILGGVTPAAATVTALTATGATSLAALSASGTTDLTGAVFALDNIELAITAHAGGGQGSAYALTKVISVVGTVGSANDSVKLPAPTKVGQIAVVINNAGANSLQVYGSGTDTINGVVTATGVAQAAGKTGLYVATTTGAAAAWFRLLSA